MFLPSSQISEDASSVGGEAVFGSGDAIVFFEFYQKEEQIVLFLHLVLQRCLIYLSCVVVTVLSACAQRRDVHAAAGSQS